VVRPRPERQANRWQRQPVNLTFCPIDSGLSAVKLSPALLNSMMRPEPVSVGAGLKIGGFADEIEIAGEHADHGVRRIVQADPASDDCGAGPEVSLPCGMGKHHDMVFGFPKAAAACHFHAEEWKKSAVTAAPARRRGSPVPVRMKSSHVIKILGPLFLGFRSAGSLAQ
jgi:hypothetical protein